MTGTTNSATDQKYDRQIRIWGEHGQRSLEASSICLINATATGTETLKNLVLPGIGSFTVIDGADVTDADRANNFFLASTQPRPTNRALAAVEAMHELNDDVLASYIPHSVDTFVTSQSAAFAFFRRFSAVIVSQIGTGHHVLEHIAAGCYKANVPLIIVRAYGLLGYIRIQAREICIRDSKEDDIAPDLRLHNPFPQLQQFVDNVHLDRITDTTEISHVPFIIILAKAVSEYQRRHPDALPSSRKEKDEFLEIVKSLRPKVCPDDAENFEEAERKSNLRLCYADAATTSSVIRQLMSDPRSDPDEETGFAVRKDDQSEKITFPEVIRLGKRSNRAGLGHEAGEPVPGMTNNEGPLQGASRINQDNAAFWIHAAAVRAFLETRKCLPLRGSLPDMTADTESYVALQKIYSSKAASDAKEVLGFAQKIAERYGVEVDVDEGSVKSFCRTVHGIRVYSTTSLAEEMQKPSNGFMDAATMEGALDASGNGLASPYYVCLRAADEFYRQHGRDAGRDASMRESDSGLVHEYVTKVKEELGISGGSGLWRDYAEEVVRYANVELHNVAAFMAGVAAQEVTKILTRQFVPVDNTLLVNFAEQTSVAFPA